jgi:hypothetical protein
MKFTEAQLEAAIIELLGAEGYPHVLGEAIMRPVSDGFHLKRERTLTPSPSPERRGEQERGLPLVVIAGNYESGSSPDLPSSSPDLRPRFPGLAVSSPDLTRSGGVGGDSWVHRLYFIPRHRTSRQEHNAVDSNTKPILA